MKYKAQLYSIYHSNFSQNIAHNKFIETYAIFFFFFLPLIPFNNYYGKFVAKISVLF